MSRRLYRSRTDRVLGGVCGGLAAHFDTDPVIFRLVFILMTVMGGSGILIYIIMLLVIPKEPAPPDLPAPLPIGADSAPVEPIPSGDRQALSAGEPPAGETAPLRRPGRGVGVGIILVAVGALFLASNLGLFWWWKWRVLWPVVLVAVGLWLMISRNGKE